ncbi:SecDF P1 head subdomain-containing protein [Planomonospora parontospora]|uniref:SecDF P1 head subdomain-containing protein n=1 Tax=Planomonospora parontospora TaxID=58119 RepID=UPI001941F54C|nr:excalibur calcium-binding domain-containing protein [Planomonospora parontospora]
MGKHSGPGATPEPQGPPPAPSGPPVPGPARTEAFPGGVPFPGPHSGPSRPGAAPGAVPGQAPGTPGGPRASRATTAVLIVALVLVVLTTGVLATIAVLMTRNPGVPLGAPPPQRLPAPIHFAPVTAAQSGPCTTPEGVPDEAGQVCYEVAAGVDVTAVRGIDAVRGSDGSYAVRITFAPAFHDRINSLTEEAVDQQIAIVVGGRVLAAPRVGEVITEDSMQIAGSFTREQAEAMVARLRGTAAGTSPPTTAPTGAPATTPPTAGPTGTNPTGFGPTGTNPTGSGSTGAPAATNPAATAPVTPPASAPATGTTAPAGQATTAPAAAPSGRTGADRAGAGGTDRRFGTCREATAAGYGPYFKESDPEYAWYVDGDGDGVACDSDRP